MVGKLDWALPVAAELAVREEGGPALDLPALQIKKAGGDFSLGRSKVEVGGLIAIFIQEYSRVAVDDGAVLVVLEMLASYRVILNDKYMSEGTTCLLNPAYVDSDRSFILAGTKISLFMIKHSKPQPQENRNTHSPCHCCWRLLGAEGAQNVKIYTK